jgi:hypothetical protein
MSRKKRTGKQEIQVTRCSSTVADLENLKNEQNA